MGGGVIHHLVLDYKEGSVMFRFDLELADILDGEIFDIPDMALVAE
ncbi:hypothetical protein DSUL_50086 [Desulfovibrionales bacterium]